MGKADQVRTDPFGTVVAAFSDVVDLIVQSQDIEERRDNIRSALENDINMLSRLLPGLVYLTEAALDGAGSESANQSFIRFKLSCCKLLKALSSHWPITQSPICH